MPLQLLDLPDELLLHIAQCIVEPEIIEDNSTVFGEGEPPNALHMLRLSCRKFCKITTPVLFQDLHLCTDDESVEKYTSILTHEIYRTHVRH